MSSKISEQQSLSMEEQSGFIWVDGRFVDWCEAKVHVLSYTFQHGAGFFEGVRCYDGELGPSVFRLDDHTSRFLDSAKILGMTLPFSKEELIRAQLDTVRKNGLRECYIRPIGYYDGKTVGVSAKGNSVHVAIATWEWGDYLGQSAKTSGIRVMTSSIARIHPGSLMIKAKANGHYVNSMLAIMSARSLGFDDALMLDTSGFVSECSTSNIFVVRHGAISTPDRSTILEGLTRNTVLCLARDSDINVSERKITRDELYCGDEVFVTGTAAELTPVIELDGRKIGDGVPGPITRKLQSSFNDVVLGHRAEYRHWLTPVTNAA